jgi:hypothetical protein
MNELVGELEHSHEFLGREFDGQGEIEMPERRVRKSRSYHLP